MTSLAAIRESAARFFAAESAAVEVEYTLAAPGMVPAEVSVWIGRDGIITGAPRFAS